MRFWIDLENLPDVLFFEPIAEALRSQGHEVVVTSRDYSDVPEVADIYGMAGDVVGRHGGERKLAKLAIGGLRSAQLGWWQRRRRIDLAIGFGSRPLALTCGVLNVPNVTVYDYEHIHTGVFNRFCDWIIVPEEIPAALLGEQGVPLDKVIRYPGLKEEVYTDGYRPDGSVREQLGVSPDEILVTVRPPATLAHYHDHTSVEICRLLLDGLVGRSDLECVLLTRADDPTFDRYLDEPNIRNLDRPVRGLDLIAASDAVVSGGGTMVREAVALGVASYSIFTGEQGAIDRRLATEGRLEIVRQPSDVGRIEFVKRADPIEHDRSDRPVLDFFVERFIELATDHGTDRRRRLVSTLRPRSEQDG